MDVTITPATALEGSVRLPGDKSISHRYAILAALADGTTTIRNYSTGADCQSTLGCLRGVGVVVDRQGTDVCIHGVGLTGMSAPEETLDAGNSGSTIRMLAGVLAAQPFPSRISGDESLSRRPMDRIMRPLEQMGAVIGARDGRFPPLEIEGRTLRPISYELPVASAQVKTCILFAGLCTDGVTTVVERVKTRDHSEIALREFGAQIDIQGSQISIQGGRGLTGGAFDVPGDISSAVFFLVAAMLVPDSRLILENVGLNPHRAAVLDFLAGMGAPIRILDIRQERGEAAGDLEVRHSGIEGGVIAGDLTAALIDEIPVLAVLGAVSRNGLEVRDARELRVKETDRITAVAENLRRMDIRVETREDSFFVPGGQRFRAATLDSFGDHRIAMAFSVASLAAEGESQVLHADAASISYPEFFDTLRKLKGE